MYRAVAPFVLLLSVCTGCGVGSDTSKDIATGPDQRFGATEQKSHQNDELERVKSQLIYCDNMVAADRPNGITGRLHCDTGDSILFSSLALLGDPTNAGIIASIKDSFADNGRPYRSPEHRRGGDSERTFSRDMTMGIALFLTVTKDRELAEKFWTFVKGNTYHVCVVEEIGCLLTPPVLAALGDVWDYLGLKKPTEMNFVRWIDEETLMQTAKSVDPGYQLHLVTMSLLVHELTGHTTRRYRRVIEEVVSRQPNNPWYRFLAVKMGAAPREGIADLDALIASQLTAWPEGTKTDWSFEKGDQEEGRRDSLGHEWVFLNNMLKSL